MLQILVTQVLVHQAQGNRSEAFTSLEHALVLGRSEGYLRIFVDEGGLMRSLLFDFRKANEKRSRSSDDGLMIYVDKLLSAFSQPSDAKRLDMQQSKWIEPTVQSVKNMSVEIEAQQEKTMLVEPLSQRELEVLRLFRTELSGPEIAQELMVALSTVRTHTKSIYSKLNVSSRRAAVERAAELKLI